MKNDEMVTDANMLVTQNTITQDQIEEVNIYLEYEEDSRAGVQNLIQKYQKQEEALKKERERTEQMKIYEHKYEDLGWICGIDEVGRGPLAGPVVAGAVILPRDTSAEKPGKCRRKKNRCDDFQIPYKHGTDLFLVEIFFYISGIHTHSVILRKTKPEKHNCSCSSGHPFNDLLFYQLFHFRCFTNTVS